MKRTWLLCATLALAGCTTTGKAPPPDPSRSLAAAPPDSSAPATPASAAAPGAEPAPKMVQGLGAAVVSPLGDFNLVRAHIPPLLLAAREAPYRLPAERECAALAAQVGALDQTLGPDLDAPGLADRPSALERSADMAGNAAVGAVQGAVSGAIPFRGWVRKLSGAERRDRRVAAAVQAGSLRRAFLKGLALAQGCALPPSQAAPQPLDSAAAPAEAAGVAAPAVVSLQESGAE